MPKVIFLDFDGVLAIKWTIPELYFPQIPEVLSQLHTKGYILCVISYNPLAKEAIRRWDLDKFVTAIRAGCNQKWDGNYSDAIHRCDLSKAEQIRDILTTELKDLPITHEDCIFLDDDVANLTLVQQHLPEVKTIHVDENTGLTDQLIGDFV